MQSPSYQFRYCQLNHLDQSKGFNLGTKNTRERCAGRLVLCLCLIFVANSILGAAQAQKQTQANLPFEVSNPQNKKWPPAEARKIYDAACQLLARTIRPDKPPALHPQFRLVLGTQNDEFVRDGAHVEVHLRSWQPEIFAQAVVAIAVRDVLQGDQLQKVAHESVLLANATVDAHDLH